jgi:hypothetical protein
MAVRLSALHAGHDVLPRNIFWYSFLSEAESTPEAVVWMEGYDKFKKFNASSGLEPATFQPVA